MKTITLKLTDREFELVCSSLDKANLIDRDLDDSSKIGFSVIDGMNTKTYIVSISNIDKFREVLNNEIKELPSLMFNDFDNLKSILSKLNKAVYNDCIVEVVQNDVPKCTKCGSKFKDEYWKTDGLKYEMYICSNEDCQAIHTINIDININRHWDTLEFMEF